MANWSKRRSSKAGNQGQRITRTTNSTGKSTYSQSKKVGNTRTTNSFSSNGKMKVTTTESHPILGRKTTTRTLNPTPKKPKKPRKTKSTTRRRSTARSYSSGGSYRGASYSSSSSSFWWWVVGIIAILVIFS